MTYTLTEITYDYCTVVEQRCGGGFQVSAMFEVRELIHCSSGSRIRKLHSRFIVYAYHTAVLDQFQVSAVFHLYPVLPTAVFSFYVSAVFNLLHTKKGIIEELYLLRIVFVQHAPSFKI
jgi:hypothetical protein